MLVDPVKQAQIDAAWAIHRPRSRSATRRARALRFCLAEQQNWRCCYCGIRMDGADGTPSAPTLEHVVPRVCGGPDTADNLVVACCKCNNDRGSEITDLHIAAVSAWEGRL